MVATRTARIPSQQGPGTDVDKVSDKDLRTTTRFPKLPRNVSPLEALNILELADAVLQQIKNNPDGRQTPFYSSQHTHWQWQALCTKLCEL